jgi:hypothetical protein
MMLEGRCHCGAVRAAFETALDPDVIQVRACQCGFCRRQGARTVSDPAGHLTLTFGPEAVNRYRFGTGTAEFLICRSCGAYLAAVMDDGNAAWGVLNIAAADVEVLTHRAADPMSYDEETIERKRDRRRARWTPVSILIEGAPA